MFFQFYIEKEQAAWVSHPKCSKKWLVCLDSQFEKSSEKPDLKTGGAQYFLRKKPWKPEKKRHATVQVFQTGNLLPPVFLKAFIHFPYVFSRHKGYKERNNMIANFKYS